MDIYETIKSENRTKYGTDIGRYGLVLLSKLYSERTHFIYELIQNAEDACQRALASGREEHYNVHFDLYPDRLEIRHNGIPFSDDDVRGVCGLVEGTKSEDKTQIGKFGIGFKSVYAYTNSPEVHSGQRSFLIKDYVLPEAITPELIETNQTLFVIPFNRKDVAPEQAYIEIAQKLAELGPMTLLFIETLRKISWATHPVRVDEPNALQSGRTSPSKGVYLKEVIGENPKRVSLLRLENESLKSSENWLVFGPTSGTGKTPDVNVAYRLAKDSKTKQDVITPVDDARLFSFFETVVETHLRFLINGRYNTTPARDNIIVVELDDWNRGLIEQTGTLVSETLSQVKALGILDVNFLSVLPVDVEHFTKSQTIFKPIYDKVRERLRSEEALLPTEDGGYTSASRALLGRGKDLRGLLSPEQLSALFNIKNSDWLNDAISVDRTPELHRYLIESLGIRELDPDRFARDLTLAFLEKQPDEWIIQFYGFLLEHEALWRISGYPHQEGPLRSKPIVRLENGSHIVPFKQDKSPRVYIPSKSGGRSPLPMVREKIAQDRTAMQFLQSLGLSEPDFVTAILEEVLPKYRQRPISVSDDENKRHVESIFAALSNLKSGDVRNRTLLEGLKTTPFLLAKNIASRKVEYHQPSEIHLGEAYTDGDCIELYFEGNIDVWLLDERYKDIITPEALGQVGCITEIHVNYGKVGYDGHVILDDSFGSHKRGLNGFDPNCEIEGLEFALQNINLARSRIIWNNLRRYEKTVRGVIETSSKQGFVNSTRGDAGFSNMGKLLTAHAWLPGRDGAFRKPSEVTLADLPEEFDSKSVEAKNLAQQLQLKSNEEEKLIASLPDDRRKAYERIVSADPEAFDKIWQFLDTILEKKGPQRQWDDSSVSPSENRDGEVRSFTSDLFDIQTRDPPPAPHRSFSLPTGGPKTEESAMTDTEQSTQHGHVGSRKIKVVAPWELRRVGKELEDKFREMTKADYDLRCQICGITFQQANGNLQAYVVHLVRPIATHLSNHFGNLVSLCGLHYALTSFGQWSFVDRRTGLPVENQERLKELIINAEKKIDENGNDYHSIPLRFFNVYGAWQSEPTRATDVELRYSTPHWKYLLELCKQTLGV